MGSDKASPSTTRRYDLDWVRVLAFWLLIVFHVAIGFVDWEVYGYRSNETGGPLLELALDFLHQWRLPVLFLISGMGTSYAFRRRTGLAFIAERATRLLIPLVFGMLVVNLPIAFFGLRSVGSADGIADLAGTWWFDFGWLGGAFHLWFLINLFIYSLISTPLFVLERNLPDGVLSRSANRVVGFGNGLGLLLLVPLPLVAVELLIKPLAFGLVGQGYEFFWYLGLFLIGYFLIQVGNPFWDALAQLRFKALGMGVVASMLLFGLVFAANEIEPGYGILVQNGGWVPEGDSFWGPITFPASILHTMNTWAWCMAVFSWAARYLNKPGRWLAYFNQSVYPFYIVHMTIVLVGLFYIRDWTLWWPLKLVLLTAGTFAGCWAVFEVVKRTAVTRALFGIKPLPVSEEAGTAS